RLVARGYLIREQRGRGQSNLYFPVEGVGMGAHTLTERVWAQVPTGVSTDAHSGVGTGAHLTSESLTSDSTLRERVVTVTTGKEEKERGLPREAKEEKKDSTWVRYDSPQWDLIERFGHQATGKVFFRFGRLDGDWFLKTDLKAIEALATANGGVHKN